MTIIILTFDGTASPGGSVTNDLYGDSGGEYPQKLAARLVNDDSSTWVWCPVDYHPEYVLYGNPGSEAASLGGLMSGKPVPVIKTAFDRAVSIATSHINANPGAKIVLSGLSQGTLPVHLMYNELLNPAGALHFRAGDLVAVVNFGDGCRPAGKTIPLPGAADPGGRGANTYPLLQSYGWSASGRIQRYPGFESLYDNYYWSFANRGDAAACVPENSFGELIAKLARALWYGVPGTAPFSQTRVYGSTMRLFDGLAVDLFSGIKDFNTIIGLLTTLTGGMSPNSIVGYLLHLLDAFGDVNNTLNRIIGLFNQWILPFGPFGIPNPHARYCEPNLYAAINGVNKSAVTIAFDFLTGYKNGTLAPSAPPPPEFWSTSLTAP